LNTRLGRIAEVIKGLDHFPSSSPMNGDCLWRVVRNRAPSQFRRPARISGRSIIARWRTS